jgi:hypothetical protein
MMKHVKFFSVVTLMFTASINIQNAVAWPAVQSAQLYVSSEIHVQSGDDDREDPDNGYECSIIGFPACEAHVD